MDVLLEYLVKDKSIKGFPLNRQVTKNNLCDLLERTAKFCSTKQEYQEEDECFFNAFNQLACSAFNNLLQRSCLMKEENQKLREKKEKFKNMYLATKKELADFKDKQTEVKCESCHMNQGELHQFEQKYQNLEKQLKKCALIINSSLDGGSKVLGRVKDILSQSDENSSSSESTVKLQDTSKGERQKLLSKSNLLTTSAKPVLSTEDDDCTILAPSSPDDSSDMETQNFGGPGGEYIVCIPETVPFDCSQLGSIGDRLLQQQKYEPSPLIHRRSARKLTTKKSVSPIKLPSPQKENKKQLRNLAAEFLDVSTYSPPILEDFILPSVANQKNGCIVRGLDRPEQTEVRSSQTTSTIKTENSDVKSKSSKSGQRPLSEQQQHFQTPKSQSKNKPLKQTRLALNKNATESTKSAVDFPHRISTKTVRVSPPPKLESKRRRKGKDPEDWPCKECYRLLREAEAAKKIDVRKMPVSMNFCPDHFNRYSYYLNTPPSFWDCGIGKPPRNGHLHPLDASVANDDEDFIE